MTDDVALDGVDAGYVPCNDAASPAVVADVDGNAVAGEGGGYAVPGDSAASLPGDDNDGDAVSGVSAGFVAKPCNDCADYACLTCTNETNFNADRNSTTGTSWKQDVNLGFRRTASVADSGSNTSGTGAPFGETDAGPQYTREPTVWTGELHAVVGVNFNHPGLPGSDWIFWDEEYRSYASFAIPGLPGTVTAWFQGDVYLDTSWGGSGQTESRAILPATPFELIAVYYGTDNLNTVYGISGGLPAEDLTAYDHDVVYSGVHPGGYGVALSIDAAVGLRPGYSYVSFFLRNLAEHTVGWHQFPSDPGEAMLFDRYPSYPPKSIDPGPTGGHQVMIPTYQVKFCTCPCS